MTGLDDAVSVGDPCARSEGWRCMPDAGALEAWLRAHARVLSASLLACADASFGELWARVQAQGAWAREPMAEGPRG